jgi:tetratricopeptide (TPR) repeat protein
MSQGHSTDKKKKDVPYVPPHLKKTLPDIAVPLEELSQGISREQLITQYQDAYSRLQQALEEKNIKLDTVRSALEKATGAWDMLSGFVVLEEKNENEGKSAHDCIGEALPSLGLKDYRSLCQEYVNAYIKRASEAYGELSSSPEYLHIQWLKSLSVYADRMSVVEKIISAFASILQAYEIALILNPENVTVLKAQAKMYSEFAEFYEILASKGTYASVQVSARTEAEKNYNAALRYLESAHRKSPSDENILKQHQELSDKLEADKEIIRKCACILTELERVQKEIVSNHTFPLPQGKGEMYKVINDAILQIRNAESGRDENIRSKILRDEKQFLKEIQGQLNQIAADRLKKNWVHRTIFGNATHFYQNVPQINESICQMPAPSTPISKPNS